MEPAALAQQLDAEQLLIVDLCHPRNWQQLHVPHAVHADPAALMSQDPLRPGIMPSPQALNALFSSLGYSPDRHIVVYDDEGGGWAGRFIWMLDAIGHSRYSYLNGGLLAWYKEYKEGHPLQQGGLQAGTPTSESTRRSTRRDTHSGMQAGTSASDKKGHPPQQSTDKDKDNEGHSPQQSAQAREARPVELSLSANNSATLEDVMNAIDDPSTAIWDARSAHEYAGLRTGSARAGHIPGAIHLDWESLKDTQSNLRLHSPEQLADLLQSRGFEPGQRIITYCQSHHRSGLSYLVAKTLGYPVQAYAGAWAEWGNLPHTPIAQVA